ncbi:type I restriction endonuclease subunit M [Rhodoferax sp. WC2427]|uniref:type I restriction endonuclease subunit M n=1 Tax=Rhodoferax sp. WC2427 TaxID=3234144 RepID=UPI0034661B11
MSIDPQPTTSHPTARTTVIYTNSARFGVGQIVATPGALELLQQTGFSAAALCSRHIHGDWGDICEEDRGENEFAITRRLRLMSVYRLVDASRLALTPRDKRGALPTVWVITEADRSVTTLLLPGDY